MGAQDTARPLRLLVVAMSGSVHTARWLRQVADQGWDVHVFSSSPSGLSHPDLRGTTVHHRFYTRPLRGIRQRGVPVFSPLLAHLGERLSDALSPSSRTRRLARLVETLCPDVVHSLEFQHSGYLTLDAKRIVGPGFPPWLATNWGSDIYHFRRFPAHEPRIRDVLATCDAYSCECERDVALARELGFRGTVLPVGPNAGGLDLAKIRPLRSRPPSRRRLVMLKGHEHWSGRALCGLRALERCADLLREFRLCVYSATPDVVRASRALERRIGVPVEVLTMGAEVPHEHILRRHGEARVSIGLSITDGVSTSFLEAFAMGAFPVQSWTSCANEWVEDGITGILVPPEDEEAVAGGIRSALTNDRLVDAAAERNWMVATERLDARALSARAVRAYRELAGHGTAPVAAGKD